MDEEKLQAAGRLVWDMYGGQVVLDVIEAYRHQLRASHTLANRVADLERQCEEICEERDRALIDRDRALSETWQELPEGTGRVRE